MMNIWAKRGDKVVFQARGGHEWERTEAEKVLNLGGVYTVVKTEVYSSMSYVFLKEVPGREFNTCLFGDYVEAQA